METISRFALTFLLNSLWQIPLLVLIASACSRMMRRSPAAYRHLLWVTTLAFSLLLPLASLEGSSSITSLWSPATVNGAGPGSAASSPAGALSTSSWLADFFNGQTKSVSFAPSVASVLVACYLLFLIYRLISLWRAWRKAKEIIGTARACNLPASIAEIAEVCQTALGLKATTILCSSSLEAPLTLGAERPLIILPESMLAAESSELVTTALGHEMAHIRRRDFLWNLIYELIHLPLSFHPAALLAKRRIKETRELACDEMVTERLISAKAYARSLVLIASSLTAIDQPSYSLGIFDANNLEERIMKLMERRPRASTRLARALFIAAVFALSASAIAASAFSLNIGQNKSAAPSATSKSIAGTWLLYPRTDGQDNDNNNRGITIILESNGDKLSGRAVIADEYQDKQGNKVNKTFEWQLIDPQFDGTNFSFKVTPRDKDGSANDGVIEGKMKLVGDGFVGRWTSENQTGDLKMLRKKE